MTKKVAIAAQARIVKSRLSKHPELTVYGDNALPLLGLGMYLHADDLDELASDAMTDGANDKKIDFCHIDRTAQFAVIAQGYTSKNWTRQAAPSNKAADLISAVGWMFSGEMDKVPTKLRSVVTELRQAIEDNEINRIELLYIHNCPESPNVESELRTAARLAADVLTDRSITIAHAELGLGRLESLFVASESEILVQDTFTIPATNVIDESGKQWRSIVATMPGDWLHKLHSEHGGRLFSANYRDYMGMRKSVKNINYGIKNSALSEPDHFWTYNNGITALTSSIGKKGMKYQLEGISIIKHRGLNNLPTPRTVLTPNPPVDTTSVIAAIGKLFNPRC